MTRSVEHREHIVGGVGRSQRRFCNHVPQLAMDARDGPNDLGNDDGPAVLFGCVSDPYIRAEDFHLGDVVHVSVGHSKKLHRIGHDGSLLRNVVVCDCNRAATQQCHITGASRYTDRYNLAENFRGLELHLFPKAKGTARFCGARRHKNLAQDFYTSRASAAAFSAEPRSAHNASAHIAVHRTSATGSDRGEWLSNIAITNRPSDRCETTAA